MTALIFSLFLFSLFQDAAAVEAPKPTWKNHAELSYVQTSGNTSTSSLAVKADSHFTGNGDRLIFSSRFVYSENKGVESSNRLVVNGRYERTVDNGLFLLFQSSFEKDKFSGYERRFYLGPGVGYDFIKTEDGGLKLFRSALYYVNKISGHDDETDYFALSGTAEAYVKPQENLRFKNQFSCSVATHTAENYRIQNEIGMEASLAGPFSLGVRYQVQYQNEPPIANVKKTDSMFLTSFIIDF